ncbi:MAG: histidine kinase [Deltaproteobacteria bacterium]|nr:histidine kinase [Deltaproteobacteria bacterium]
MQRRVREILLVSSPYDSFVLAEDGKLQEKILSEYMEHSLSYAPGLTRVSSGVEALSLAREQHRFNLIVTTMHIDDMSVVDFARQVRAAGIGTPIILLTYDNRELADLLGRFDTSIFDRIFNWQGDFRIFLTIVKHIEDQMNVVHDNHAVGVQVIILVEDSIRYYSSYLPMFYSELFKQSQKVIEEGPSTSQKLMRMRARPKILLANTFEQAIVFFETYRKDVLGVISDIRFPRDGALDVGAGIELVRRVRAARPDLPVLLQSSQPENAQNAHAVGASFLWKNSETLLEELRAFMIQNFAFGDFVFRMPDGREMARAANLRELEEVLPRVPDESLLYHAERDHFSNWLKARTEFVLADRLKPHKVSEYATVGDLRGYLTEQFHEQRLRRYRGIVVDFNPDDFETSTNLARIGSGSIGGKARGLAFISMLLNQYGIRDNFPGVRVLVPGSVVLCTDVFNEFLAQNDLWHFALACADDAEIFRRFMAAEFPDKYVAQLESYLSGITYPLAVRSSSILEDSLYQPFAGVYETYMVPNNDADAEVRLGHLLAAIKGVFASTFSNAAKDYVKATNYRLEEEQMAVIIQRVIGNRYADRYYPHFSGVARSHNSYPVEPAKADDGIVALALGLGQAVVDGSATMSFCPRYPRTAVGFATPRDWLKYSQNRFFALDLGAGASGASGADEFLLKTHDLTIAEADGVLPPLCSTYSAENDALYDGASRPGARVVTFAPVLKHGAFPLPDILKLVMDMGRWGMNSPVEIEFAVNLAPETGGPQQFAMLQMRPLVRGAELSDLKIDVADDRLVCRSPKVLGNGRLDKIRDVIVVDAGTFDRSRSRDVAAEVAYYNSRLAGEGVPYILFGVGRWGSTDPWLGIPVQWGQISGVKVIVEAGFTDFRVTPSQGSHFFQNLTSFMVGYFTVNEYVDEGFVDWTWLAAQEPVSKRGFTRHLRFDQPLTATMNGRTGEGIICKPGVWC